MYRGPEGGSSGGGAGLQPSSRAVDAGALAEATAKPPARAILVAPGGSIQKALDRATEGGWVVLAKGLHTIPATLRIPSGVTLAGGGRETVVFLDPKAPAANSAIAIENAVADLKDVTLRDFVIEGATSSQPSRDPNQERRMRSYQHAPSRGGILFSADQPGQMRNLRFEHLTVRHCTHNAVAIRGAAQVTIAASDFGDSGSSVVPGPGLEHNLLLTRVIGADVIDSRFDDSPWGNGIDLTFSRDITIANNELARNAHDGVHAADCENVRIAGNLAEGNDAAGIEIGKWFDGSRRVTIRNNVARNNGGGGIVATGVVGADVAANIEVENGEAEQVRLERSTAR